MNLKRDFRNRFYGFFERKREENNSMTFLMKHQSSIGLRFCGLTCILIGCLMHIHMVASSASAQSKISKITIDEREREAARRDREREEREERERLEREREAARYSNICKAYATRITRSFTCKMVSSGRKGTSCTCLQYDMYGNPYYFPGEILGTTTQQSNCGEGDRRLREKQARRREERARRRREEARRRCSGLLRRESEACERAFAEKLEKLEWEWMKREREE